MEFTKTATGMSLPSCEQIRKVTDVKSLQDACESLVRLVEKEKKSKQQYRQTASALKKENETLGFENECLRLKNETLTELASNGSGAQNCEIERLHCEKEELERQIEALKNGKLSEVQKQLEESLKRENEELRKKLESGGVDEVSDQVKEQLEQKDAAIVQFENERKILEGILENNKAKAKERIAKLKETIAQMTEQHRGEVETLSKKLDDVGKERDELSSEKEKMAEGNKEKVAKLREQKKKWKQKFLAMRSESEGHRKRIEELEIQVHDEQRQNTTMIQKISELEKRLQNVADSNDRNSSLTETIQRLNMELFEMKQTQQANEEFKTAIADRDAMISKLKEQVQSLMKMDSERNATITDLRSEICRLTEKIATLSSGDSAKLGLAQMEREKAMLEEKLNKSQASEELKKKNQQLQEMIERSNALYVQVKEENRELRNTLKGRKTAELSMLTDVVVSLEGTLSKKRNAKKLAQTAYLERVLRQFFTEDESNRASLIPVILKLINCTNEQIEVVTRQWDRTTNPLHRLFGW